MKKMNLRLLSVLFFILCGNLFAQTAEDKSGIEYTTSNSVNEFNLLKIKIDSYDTENQLKTIQSQLLKNTNIKSVDIDYNNNYVYIKYTNSITPNEILKQFHIHKTIVHYKDGESIIQYQEIH